MHSGLKSMPKKEKLCRRPALLRYYIPGEGVVKNICIHHVKEIEKRGGIHVLMLLPSKNVKCDLFRFEVDA